MSLAYSCDLTEQYLDKLYEDLQKEQQRVLQDIKTSTDFVKEMDSQKQVNLLNNLMLNTLRLRNLRKKIRQRLDT